MFVFYLEHFYSCSFIFETDSIEVLTEVEVKLCFYYLVRGKEENAPKKQFHGENIMNVTCDCSVVLKCVFVCVCVCPLLMS